VSAYQSLTSWEENIDIFYSAVFVMVAVFADIVYSVPLAVVAMPDFRFGFSSVWWEDSVKEYPYNSVPGEEES